MKANNLFFAALGAVALIAMAGNGQAMGSPPPAPTITQADAGKSVTLSVGERLTVHLSAQLGTGYGWAAASDSTPLLKFENSGALGSATMPGGAQTQELVFIAAGAGQGTLKLEYRQPWVKDTPPSKTFSVAVTVTP
jgi:predicted secreted protein